MNLNELAAQSHQIAVDHGFNVATRDPGRTLMLIVTEVAEAMEEIRQGNWDAGISWISTAQTSAPDISVSINGIRTVGDPPRLVTDEDMLAWGFEPKPVGLPSELADIIIRTLDAAAAWGIDIEAAVAAKIEYNRKRPHLHGRPSDV